MIWYGELGNTGSVKFPETCGVSDIATGRSAISADLRVAGLIGRNPGPDSVSTEPGKTDIAGYFKFIWV